MTHHSDFDAWQEPPPKVHWITKADADSKAVRAFAYAAVIFGAVGFALGWWLS